MTTASGPADGAERTPDVGRRFTLPLARLLARWGWVTLILAVGTLVRVPRLSLSLMDEKPFRAPQTAFTIRWMADHSLDPFHPNLPILGPPWQAPLEFPL